MYQSEKELRQEIESLNKKVNALAADLAGEMIKVNDFSRENKDLRMKAEALEKERDEWHEKYCEEASDLFAAEFSIEEYAGFETHRTEQLRNPQGFPHPFSVFHSPFSILHSPFSINTLNRKMACPFANIRRIFP